MVEGLSSKPTVEFLSGSLESRIRTEAEKYKGIPLALSGGIDSGTLASFIEPKFAISVDLPGGDKYHEGQYARVISDFLGIKLVTIQPDPKEFEAGVREAVKAIGRPIPHFNIYPLWAMYRELAKMGVDKVILADGPDETMCGYARNLIMAHIYGIKNYDAFRNYTPLIDKALPKPHETYAAMTGQPVHKVWELMKDSSLIKGMNTVDMVLMRKDMDDMSNGIARSFGITNIRPYQDNTNFDIWQYNLPDEAKIHGVEYGKYALRLIAQRRIPHDLAWRKTKVGGPVWPTNLQMGWLKSDGEFGKAHWLKYQEDILR
jgi:asparagine synthetase B (glutamine-hydrolysing)